MSVPGPEPAPREPLFCTAFASPAYFLCGTGGFAQFRLPGVEAAAITPALGAMLV